MEMDQFKILPYSRVHMHKQQVGVEGNSPVCEGSGQTSVWQLHEDREFLH